MEFRSSFSVVLIPLGVVAGTVVVVGNVVVAAGTVAVVVGSVGVSAVVGVGTVVDGGKHGEISALAFVVVADSVVAAGV